MFRLGLRAQIVIALSVVFALSFALLGTATVQLTSHAGEVDRARASRLWAEAVGVLADVDPDSEAALDRVLGHPAARGQIAALRVERSDGSVFARGRPEGTPTTVPLAAGRTLTFWLDGGHRQRRAQGSVRPQGRDQQLG